MTSSWNIRSFGHRDEALTLSHGRRMTRLPLYNGHMAQCDYYHNFGSIHRYQYNRQAYKLQIEQQKLNNIRLPMQTSVNNKINNNNNHHHHHHHHHRLVNNLIADDNNNNNNKHDEAINSNMADASSDLSGLGKSTPPTSPIDGGWKIPNSGIVRGRSFAAVVASGASPTSVSDGRKINIIDDVDDGFEEESSISQNIINNVAIGGQDESSDDITDKFRQDSESRGLDGEMGSNFLKNPQQTIKDIPERFKKLLKAAQDKATAQRLRVEGVPLIRGYPQPTTGYLYPQTIPPDSFSCCLAPPSYPQEVPVSQTAYQQSKGPTEASSPADSMAQKIFKNPSQSDDQPNNQTSGIAAPQQNGCSYGNVIPVEQHLSVNQGNINCLPVQTTYGQLAYYIAPNHHYQMVYGVVNENNASCCYGYNANGIYMDQQQLYYQQQYLYQQSLYQQQLELYASRHQQPLYDQMVAY